jgi:hypothetical protein
MKRTYAVAWQDERPSEDRHVGKLSLGAASASFEGGTRGRESSRTIYADELTDVRLDRSQAGRVDGRPSILLSLRNGSLVRVVSLDQPGTVPEIANSLTALAQGAR